MRDLLEYIPALVIAFHCEQKQAAPAAGLLPPVADLALLARVVVAFVGLAFIFHGQHAAIHQLGHEIGLALVRGREQPE